jgi:hypothetical protein
MHATAYGTEMSKQNISHRSFTQQDRQEKLYVLRLSGFWGKVAAGAMLLLLVPLVVAFFLFFVFGLVAVTVIGIGYAWWHMRKLRRMRPPEDRETIELAASEYHALEEPSGKRRRTEAER